MMKPLSVFAGDLRIGVQHCVLVLSALLAGCQHLPASFPFVDNPVAKAAELTGELPPAAERVWVDPDQDVLNARARGYGLVHMPEMQAYLNGLLARIKEQAGVPDWPGQVYILASTALEAYATDAGNIYISQSWLASAESEDEIVALLSHEFGHVYLHYHQLEDVLKVGDQAANIAALAMTLSSKANQTQGWTSVDSMSVSYLAGSKLLAAAWGRSQESAADTFGLNVSLKLGYSYEAGFKTFFERMASWEEENSERQEALAQEMLKQIQEQAAQLVQQGSDPMAQALLNPLAQLNVGLNTVVQTTTTGLESLWERSTAQHPVILSRMDSLAAAIDVIPFEELPSTEPKVDSWNRVKKQKRTAQILNNYALAVRAQSDLSSPTALKDAQRAASGASASHALPLHVLYQTQLAQAGRQGHGMPKNGSAVLERNFKTAPDRAWLAYLERTEQLRASGQPRQAQAVMQAGFNYFRDAEEVWPKAIAFYGENQGWDVAKKLAEECVKRFSRKAKECKKAAISPTEQDQLDKTMEGKAKSLLNKLF